jgi:flagella basal body P-ring formation protein FlgA
MEIQNMRIFKVSAPRIVYGWPGRVVGALFSTLLIIQVAGAADLRLRMLEKVEINSDEIRFGDVCHIDSGDPAQREALERMVIGSAPPPGSSRRVDRSYLELRLRQHGFEAAEYIFDGGSRCDVIRGFIEISREKIEALLKDYVQQQLRELSSPASIREIRTHDSVVIPKGPVSFKVYPAAKSGWVGKVPLVLELTVGQSFQRKVWGSVTLQLLGEVVVTHRPVGRYKPITEDDIEIQTRDLAELPAGVITDPEAVLGKRAKRNIGSNTVLRSDLVELPPLVKRGDMVVILAETPGLKITTLGEVKKTGRLGERIPVMNYDSKKMLYARVVDANTVEVEF